MRQVVLGEVNCLVKMIPIKHAWALRGFSSLGSFMCSLSTYLSDQDCASVISLLAEYDEF